LRPIAKLAATFGGKLEIDDWIGTVTDRSRCDGNITSIQKRCRFNGVEMVWIIGIRQNDMACWRATLS